MTPSAEAPDAVLVVGAGQAAAQLADTLRDLGHTGPIHLVGAEPVGPYQRPPLSKDYLADRATADGLQLRTARHWRERDVELRTGERVVEIDLSDGAARTNRGTTVCFDRLALTTGARARTLSLPGAGAAEVVGLRDLSDADRLARLLPVVRRVVVIGAGFIGLEAAAMARARGAEVDVVDVADQVCARGLSVPMSAAVQAAHERRGTRFHLGRAPREILLDAGHVAAIALDDGSTLPADLVLVGVGADPRTELADQLGLPIALGAIAVDRCGRTSHPQVVAAGDCTAAPSSRDPDRLVRLESVAGAVAQGAAAAAALVGCDQLPTAPPWFWSTQGPLTLQMVGEHRPDDDLEVIGDPAGERLVVHHHSGGRHVATQCLGSPAEFLRARRSLGTPTRQPA